jgi:hypothetical protein
MSSTLHAVMALSLGKVPPVPNEQEAEWATVDKNTLEKRRISCIYHELNPYSTLVQPLA